MDGWMDGQVDELQRFREVLSQANVTQLGTSMAGTWVHALPRVGQHLCLALHTRQLAAVIPTLTALPWRGTILPSGQTGKLRLREAKSPAQSPGAGTLSSEGGCCHRAMGSQAGVGARSVESSLSPHPAGHLACTRLSQPRPSLPTTWKGHSPDHKSSWICCYLGGRQN